MKPEAQRIAIAEACGWVWYRHPVASSLKEPHYKFLAFPASQEFEQSPEWMVRSDGTEKPCSIEYIAREFHLPDYLNDLNAMHEAEKLLDNRKWTVPGTIIKGSLSLYDAYACELSDRFGRSIRATAAQRAEAFLRTIGKWVED